MSTVERPRWVNNRCCLCTQTHLLALQRDWMLSRDAPISLGPSRCLCTFLALLFSFPGVKPERLGVIHAFGEALKY